MLLSQAFESVGKQAAFCQSHKLEVRYNQHRWQLFAQRFWLDTVKVCLLLNEDWSLTDLPCSSLMGGLMSNFDSKSWYCDHDVSFAWSLLSCGAILPLCPPWQSPIYRVSLNDLGTNLFFFQDQLTRNVQSLGVDLGQLRPYLHGLTKCLTAWKHL